MISKETKQQQQQNVNYHNIKETKQHKQKLELQQY